MAGKQPDPAAMKAAMMQRQQLLQQQQKQQMQQRPVTGTPVPNSDMFLYMNSSFQQEFETCAAKLAKEEEYDIISFECDIVQKLNIPDTKTYSTTLRIPRGCMVRAKQHPIFRRLLVQSMWLQMQPGMLRYKGKDKGQPIPINPKDPVCTCANPPCNKSAVRFVGNPGFFPKKNMLIDPYCVPVCMEPACVLQAQQMSNTIHAKAQQEEQHQASHAQQLPTTTGENGVASATDATPGMASSYNPALKSQMPQSIKSCNMCGSFEQKYGGTAVMLRSCPLCNITYYCSQQCQIQDWQRGHKDVCVNVKGNGGGAVMSAAAANKNKASKKPTVTPATIPEETSAATANGATTTATTTSAPAPAPAPMPMATAPVPAPAPMPVSQNRKVAPSKAAPRPVAAAPPTSSTTASAANVPNITQSMANMPMPTYKMPEPPVPTSPTGTSANINSNTGYGMPTYKMMEPPVGAGVAPPAYKSGAPTTAPPTTAAATPSTNLPIKQGRKKAE